jgi:hypothetical protein
VSAPVCHGCGEPIHGAGIGALGVDWHPEHFVCAICGQPISGNFRVDPDGKPYCAGKPADHRACWYCGRLLTSRAAHGADRCDACLGRAVSLSADAQQRFIGVVRWAYDNGLVFPNAMRLRVDLASPAQLGDGDRANGSRTSGMAIHRTLTRNGVTTAEFDRILIERGLPAVYFESVAAHELGHCWLAMTGVFGSPKWAEEGFCNLIEDRWLREQTDADAKTWLRRLEMNTDPAYGDGYRWIAGVAKTQGFDRLIAAIRTERSITKAAGL